VAGGFDVAVGLFEGNVKRCLRVESIGRWSSLQFIWGKY
jgi:hypothetical protein